MINDTALTQAQNLIKLPVKSNIDWIVKFFDGGTWKTTNFTLIEDAWAFFYSKLNELKQNCLSLGNQRQYA